jgi:mRNA interferase MazF
MAISFHPQSGAVVVCTFDMLRTPEITKRRPVIVISPNFKSRDNLCTVVPLSKSAPEQVMPYHHKIFWDPLLPEPYTNPSSWVLGDMIYTVSFERLKLLHIGKDANGKRINDNRVLPPEEFKSVRKAVLNGIGLGILTRHI